MNKLIGLLCAVFIFTLVGNAHPLLAQTITTFEKVEDYQLPYPGVLPDNPLYVLKELRERFQIITAGDELSKEQIKLQISDKNISAALELAKKGKHKLAVERIQKANEQFDGILNSLKDSEEVEKKENNGKITSQRNDFINLLRKANLKHREAIETLMKDTPSGQVEQLEKLRQSNIELQKKIETLSKL